MKIVNTQQMKELELQAESRGLPSSVLMENAGKASAEQLKKAYRLSGKEILMLVGPGNNGGDGLVAARYLHKDNTRITIALGSPRKPPDKNLDLVQQNNIAVIDAWKDFRSLEKALADADIVIDALFGTGKARPIEGIYKSMLEKLREQKRRNPSIKIVSLDLPSGLDADTGSVDSSICPADMTITMAFPKKGFFSVPGAEYLGQLITVDIGIPPDLAENINTELLDASWVRVQLPARPIGAHKGTFGKVMVVAGSSRYFGAPYLACAGAYRAGAGLVTLASTQRIIEITGSKSVETTYLPLPESQEGNIDSRSTKVISVNLESYDTLLIGPGIGTNKETSLFLQDILSSPGISRISLVLDADALNIIASNKPGWWRDFSSKVILSPHPAEFSRLTGLNVADIQKNRMETTKEYAIKWNKIIVLKGAFTVIAAPQGQTIISPWANPALATAGTGDVLAGIIAAFLAQGVQPFASAALGVYIHGLAGELVREEIGDSGAIASDLLPKIPLAIKKIQRPKLDSPLPELNG